MTAKLAHRCELLTPPGAGAIAMIRIIGPSPDRLVDQLFRPTNGRSLHDTVASRLRYGPIVRSDEVIDDVVAYRIENAHPPAVELCCHGGIRVVERIIEALVEAGAALDTSDETPSPWLAATHIEREALDLLPRARTRDAVKFLAFQRASTPHWLQHAARCCSEDPDEAHTRIDAFLKRADSAFRIIHGAAVALVGPPNSGKSTLFNRLVGRDVAIVSSTKGTTRDWVSAPIEISGIPITLIDTAGHHPAGGELERLAMKAGARVSLETDLSLLVVDRSKPLLAQANFFDPKAFPTKSILVFNKCDIPDGDDVTNDVDFTESTIKKRVYVSAISGDGMADLATAIAAKLGVNGQIHSQYAAFTRRQTETARRVLDLLAHDGPAAARTIKHELIGRSG